MLHGGFKGGQIDFVQRALVDFLVDAMALELFVVGGEVLDGGDHALALHAADVGDAESDQRGMDLRRSLQSCGPRAERD